MGTNGTPFLKIILVLAAATGLAWWVHEAKITPLKAQRDKVSAQATELREKIAVTRNAIGEIRQLEQKAADMPAVSPEMRRHIPEGPAMVWLPQRLKLHFESFELPTGVTRMISIRDAAGLPGWKRSYWAVSFPEVKGELSASSLLTALTTRESQFPFVDVTEFSFRPSLNDPGSFVAAVSISALVRE